MRIVTLIAILLLACSSVAQAGSINVYQEDSGGTFQFLGTIDAYSDTGNTTIQHYDYTSASYTGFVPMTSDQSSAFFVQTSDGLSFFSVHDKRNDGDGGSANANYDLSGDGDGMTLQVKDDTGDGGYWKTLTGSGSTGAIGDASSEWSTRHKWLNCCTDGTAWTDIEGTWTLDMTFTALGSYDGGELTTWAALSSDGSKISLNLATGRTVRFAVVPLPGAAWLGLALLGGLAGLRSVRRRRRRMQN